ncbi:MAG: hypothetical protein HGB26_06245 [Desulfobulbaceae bacterium]|nr:hypothetical protein [Desulfobulbaceae bacterium]
MLVEAVLSVHNAVAGLAVDPGGLHPGTTIVALHVKGGDYHLAWVRDSRTWLAMGGTIQHLTVDHTVTQQLVAWGGLSPEEVRHPPDRAADLLIEASLAAGGKANFTCIVVAIASTCS